MSTKFHVLNSLESLKGIPAIRTFDNRGGIPSLQTTTTEVRNMYMVYQQVISLVSLLRLPALLWQPLGRLPLPTLEQPTLTLEFPLLTLEYPPCQIYQPSFELESSVLFSFKLATTTCKVRVMFLLKKNFLKQP